MGTQLPPPKRGQSPQFSANVCCGKTAGRIKILLGTEVDLGPCHIVLDGFAARRERGTAAPALFGPCLLWPRSPISAAAKLFTVMLLMGIQGCQTVSPSVDRSTFTPRFVSSPTYSGPLNAAIGCLAEGISSQWVRAQHGRQTYFCAL